MENEPIATVDAASGTEIKAKVRLTARGTAIRGAYVKIVSADDLILARVREVTMINPVHEDDAFAPMIMKTGFIPHWSGQVDIEEATLEIVGVKDIETGKRIPLRRNPASGTPIAMADQAMINEFASENVHYLTIGYIPNSGGLKATIVNRNFGPTHDAEGRDIGGFGEGHHIGILGQNGSGKTVLLTTTLAGRLSAHPRMGLLMPDTSGDLCDSTKHSRGDYQWNYRDVLHAANVEIEVIKLKDIKITSPQTLIFKLGGVFKPHQLFPMETINNKQRPSPIPRALAAPKAVERSRNGARR